MAKVNGYGLLSGASLWCVESEAAECLVLKQFQCVIDFLMHMAGLTTTNLSPTLSVL